MRVNRRERGPWLFKPLIVVQIGLEMTKIRVTLHRSNRRLETTEIRVTLHRPHRKLETRPRFKSSDANTGTVVLQNLSIVQIGGRKRPKHESLTIVQIGYWKRDRDIQVCGSSEPLSTVPELERLETRPRYIRVRGSSETLSIVSQIRVCGNSRPRCSSHTDENAHALNTATCRTCPQRR